MDGTIPGLHHVTAIAGGAPENLHFYTEVLGLRLVKRTVNFDAPDTYHLYYGDSAGRPGTLLTFFPFGPVRRGRSGPGMATEIAFAVPKGALPYWQGRLAEHDVETAAVLRLIDETECSARDAAYVALAQALGVPLVTGDRALTRRFPETAVVMEDVAEGA